MHKMKTYKTSLDLEKVKKVKLCYKANHTLPLLIGMNDSMGVNTGLNPFGKSFFDILNQSLSDSNQNNVLPCFSLLFNKTEHVDYFLKKNVSLAEIKYMQIYGLEEAVYKVLRDIHIPDMVANTVKHIMYLMKLSYHPTVFDKNIHISDALRKSKDPIFIYSSGPNDLMRIYGNNPFSIGSSYRNRKKDPSFDYTVKEIQNPELFHNVMKSVEENIKLIQKINPSVNIFVLGSFVPKAFMEEEMNIFRNIVLEYNEQLKALCLKYQLHFIDTYALGERFNTSKLNFHLNQKGHYALANEVLDLLYEAFQDQKKEIENRIDINDIYHQNGDASGVSAMIEKDYTKQMMEVKELEQMLEKNVNLTSGELRYYKQKIKRAFEIADEHEREKTAAMRAYHKTHRK